MQAQKLTNTDRALNLAKRMAKHAPCWDARLMAPAVQAIESALDSESESRLIEALKYAGELAHGITESTLNPPPVAHTLTLLQGGRC